LKKRKKNSCGLLGLHSFCSTHDISLHYSLQPHRIPGARPRCACCWGKKKTRVTKGSTKARQVSVKALLRH
jgi:hypothetical protein